MSNGAARVYNPSSNIDLLSQTKWEKKTYSSDKYQKRYGNHGTNCVEMQWMSVVGLQIKMLTNTVTEVDDLDDHMDSLYLVFSGLDRAHMASLLITRRAG